MVPLPTLSGDAVTRAIPSRLERVDRADDVDDRVERADFVQVNLVDRRTVYARLGLGQSPEQRLRALFPSGTSADPSISRSISDKRCGVMRRVCVHPGPCERDCAARLERGDAVARSWSCA